MSAPVHSSIGPSLEAERKHTPAQAQAEVLQADRLSRTAEWKANWTIVLSAFVGFAIPSVAMHSTGLFFEPLASEFGWSRGQISAGLTLAGVMTVPLSPLFGALIDRWGSRKLAIPGVALTGCALASFSLASGSFAQWMALWFAYGLIVLLAKATVWTAAVSNAFDSGRGLALAITLCGAAFSQVVNPPLVNFLIEGFGWRQAYVLLGLIWGVPSTVLVVLFLRDVGPAGRAEAAQKDLAARERAALLPGIGFKEALHDRALIRLGLATLLTITLGAGIVVHKVPLLVEAGVTRTTAAYLASMGGVAAILGKLITGWLMDRFHAGTIGAITTGLVALAFLLLLEPFRSPLLIVVSMMIVSYGAGTTLQVCAYLTGIYAGMRNFGKIFGVMASIVALGSGLGPMLTGFAYDAYGSYTAIILASALLSLIAAALQTGLGPYPDWRSAAAPATA